MYMGDYSIIIAILMVVLGIPYMIITNAYSILIWLVAIVVIGSLFIYCLTKFGWKFFVGCIAFVIIFLIMVVSQS